MMIGAALLLTVAAWLLWASACVARAETVVMYKSPTCSCCAEWAKHVERAGFHVETRIEQNMSAVKAELGVFNRLTSCHTATVGGYVLEGHVPADVIVRLLDERPQVRGLGVPGMPLGSPGMEGNVREPFDVLAFDERGRNTVFARRLTRDHRDL